MKFSVAAFLSSVSTENIGASFVKFWARVYTRLPNKLMVDQGSALGKTEVFAPKARTSNVELENTGIEPHSSFGVVERYLQPLRTTYRKLIDLYPSQDKALLLECAVKGMNDTLGTLGPEEFVPSVLVFGEYPPA